MRQEVLGDERDFVSLLQQGLACRLGKERFELWFGSQVRWERSGDMLHVIAPNAFVADRLRRQFAREVRAAVHAVCGAGCTVEFRVQEAAPGAVAASVPEPAPVLPSGTGTGSIAIPSPPAALGTNRSTDVPVASSRDETRERSPSHGTARRTGSLATFVVGVGNRVAYAAAQSIVERPGVVSPLFLYGPAGSGKSHLLEAICAAVRADGRARRAVLLTAEQFTCHFLEALQGRGLPMFRRKCREVDLLAIDDLQFLAGKRATLLEFQHTLDALTRQGRQVVVSADRAPAELAGLGAELVTRLTGGLVCGIECADYETRLGVTKQFVAIDQLALPEGVLQMIAAETSGDARQIRGALHRLRATRDALGQPITLDLARQALSDIFAASQRLVRLPDVERAVCEVFGMEARSLRDGDKSKAISQPRMLAMWLARKYTRAAFSEIGEYFGRRSHSTVISAERKVNGWVAQGVKLQLGPSCWSVDEALRRIETRLRTG